MLWTEKKNYIHTFCIRKKTPANNEKKKMALKIFMCHISTFQRFNCVFVLTDIHIKSVVQYNTSSQMQRKKKENRKKKYLIRWQWCKTNNIMQMNHTPLQFQFIH